MIVKHRNGSYEVMFTTSLAALTALPDSAFIITDENVQRIFGKFFPHRAPVLAVNPGEASKSTTAYLDCIHWLASKGASRSSVVVALGGGVVGDLAGFVAATYMRGIDCIQIPTTLLAQVDSSVGGKCGVDLPEGKNMLGSFHPPVEVRVPIDALSSLSPRQYANGMAEVLKYGFIMAPEIIDQVRSGKADEAVVGRCIECKRDVVEADEFETTGRRAILNFGHSVGHALEVMSGYADLLHGEAISIGMTIEAGLSERLGMSPAGTQDLVAETLSSHNLPSTHPLLHKSSDLIEIIRRDKKSKGGRLAFSLLRGIGNCELVADVAEADVLAAIVQ